METKPKELSGWRGPVGVTVVGLVGDVALGAAKLLAGVLCHSQAIFADGLHSTSDAATDVAVLAGLGVSGRPADATHPYGHRRAMTLVTALLAVALMAAGGYMLYRAVVGFRRLSELPPAVRPVLPLALAVVSIVLKEALYQLTARTGRQVGDSSLIANAWHHRSDAASSVAAAAGLAGAAIGGPEWHFLDLLTAMVLAAFLAAVAWRIFRDAMAELMDTAPSPAVLDQIAQSVAGTRGVRSFHAFRARRLGGKVEMDVHVQVDPDLSVAAGHDIARAVRDRVRQHCPTVLSVIVHVEPAEE